MKRSYAVGASLIGALILVAAGVTYGLTRPTSHPTGKPALGLRAPRAASAPGLHVSGNQLVDQNNGPVRLRGANMAGTEFVCAQGWSADPFGGQPEDNAATFTAMHSWGINVVRIPLNEDCWLGINGVRIGGTAYQTPILKLVRDLEASGFYVIVDLHWSAPGAQKALSQNPAPDQDHSPAFWSDVATQLKGDGNVLFDLYNEPFFYWLGPGNSDTYGCLWTGCVFSQYETGGSPFTITANWQSAGYTQLIASIRAAGAPNVIMASGVNWARDLSGWLTHRSPDPNVVAAWHSYPSGNSTLLSECAALWCWNQVIAPIAAVVPVVVGETGDSTNGPVSFLPGFLPFADANHLNVVAWTWNAWTNPNDVLVTNMQTGAPTLGEGVFYKNWLAGGVVPTPSPTASSPSPTPLPSPTPSTSPTAAPTPTPSSTSTPLPSPSPSPTPPANLPCVVIQNGVLVVGTCTGFSPGGNP